MTEIDKSIQTRVDNYPDKFYQVLEYLDIVMRNWVGDQMGSSGTRELDTLCGIFAVDWELEYYLPPSARAWFIQLIKPKDAWRYHHENQNVFGGMLKAYADLRQFLIDNAERVTADYHLVSNCREMQMEILKIIKSNNSNAKRLLQIEQIVSASTKKFIDNYETYYLKGEDNDQDI